MKARPQLISLILLAAFAALGDHGFAQSTPSGYTFTGGYPTPETVQKAYDDADLNRAIQAYRVFYPTVSGAALFKGNAKIGVIPNKSFGTLDTQPKHVGYTLNSDTPYAPLLLDLTDGPMVIDMPPGPLICVAMDLNQRWVADMGIPGPDADKGGKHLLLPPGYKGEVPAGYHTATSTTYRMLVGVRSLPVGGDVPAAIERIKTVKVHPLNPSPGWMEPTWLDLTPPPQDTTPLAWENNLQYWQVLHEVVDSEPLFALYRDHYGELAALGIAKGQPFAPDARMQRILEQAAQMASAQMRVESFADRRPDRIVWKDRQWEWAALRFEDGDFNAPNYADTYARVVSLDSVDEIRTTRACSLSTPDARDTIHLRIALWNAPSAPVVRGRRPAVRASKSEIPSRDAGPGSRECDSRSLSAVRALDRPSSGSPVTPAMAAGMMDSVWTMEALLSRPARPVSDPRHCVALSSTLSRDTTQFSVPGALRLLPPLATFLHPPA